MDTIDTDDLISFQTAAVILGCEKQQISRWVSDGRLVPVRIAGKPFLRRTGLARPEDRRGRKKKESPALT